MQVAEAICPGCARRAADTPLGLCSKCVVQRAQERFVHADRIAASTRNLGWTERTRRDDASLATLRQQRSRLRRAVRPQRPAPPDADPWVVAEQGLLAIGRVRQTVRNVRALGDLDEAAEALRRLAWGPEGGIDDP